jgi:hypothetical protein
VLKNDWARIIKDAVEDKAVSTAIEELRQLGLALLDRLVPETVTIEFEKIEGTEDCGVMMPSQAAAQVGRVGHTAPKLDEKGPLTLGCCYRHPQWSPSAGPRHRHRPKVGCPATRH